MSSNASIMTDAGPTVPAGWLVPLSPAERVRRHRQRRRNGLRCLTIETRRRWEAQETRNKPYRVARLEARDTVCAPFSDIDRTAIRDNRVQSVRPVRKGKVGNASSTSYRSNP
jgi:hypothetical protein